MRQLYRVTDPTTWQDNIPTSFFLKDLRLLLPIYTSSVKMMNGELIWRWNANGLFSCSSAYRLIHDTGVVCDYHRKLWAMRIPMKVRIFMWLFMDNRLLTQEILHMRACPVDTGCALCNSREMETRDHIFWECTYASAFWQGLCARFNVLRPGTVSVGEAWLKGRKSLDTSAKRLWDTMWAAGAWALWKERNRRTFSGTTKPFINLIDVAMVDIHNWTLFV